MHELSIARSLLHRVDEEARRHQASGVRRVRLRLGELSGVEPELLRSAFELLRAGTLCDSCDLAIERVAATWTCDTCGVAIEPGSALRCPSCRRPASLTAGGEMLLESLELEVA